MVITNAKIVGPEDVIENGYVLFKKDKIIEVKSGEYHGNEEVYDAKGNITYSFSKKEITKTDTIYAQIMTWA